MFKTTIAAAAAAVAFAPAAAPADPTANVEANASYPMESIPPRPQMCIWVTLVEKVKLVTTYREDLLLFTPSLMMTTRLELSGKVGITYAATEAVDVYGELAGITNGEDSDGDEIIDWGAKLGATWNF